LQNETGGVYFPPARIYVAITTAQLFCSTSKV